MKNVKIIDFLELDNHTKYTWNKGKVPFYFDNNGNSKTFFNYHGVVCNLSKYHLAESLGEVSLKQEQAYFKDHLEKAVTEGKTLCIYMDEEVLDLNQYFEDTSIANIVFDAEAAKSSPKILGIKPKNGFKVCVLVKIPPDDCKALKVLQKFDVDKFDFIRVD